MDEETNGVVPEEGTTTKTEEAPPQSEDTQPKTVSIEEFQKLQTELENTRRAQAGSDRMVAQLRKEKERAGSSERSAADSDYLNKKLDLILQQQSGHFDETAGSVQQQLAKLDGEYVQKKQALEQVGVYEQHVTESLETIRDILETRGLNPDDDSLPEVKEIQALYNDALSKGHRLDGVIAKAVKVTAASKGKDAQPSREDIEKEVRQQIHEEEKKSPRLKVETGGAESSVSATLTGKQKIKAGWEEIHKKQ